MAPRRGFGCEHRLADVGRQHAHHIHQAAHGFDGACELFAFGRGQIEFDDAFDTALLISADSDLAPPIEAVRSRFPSVWTPGRSDLCFATTNRQSALMDIAPRVDVFVVIGSANSSNTRALERLALEAGCSTVLRISAHIPQASPAVQDVFVPSFRRLWHMTGGGVSTQEHWGGSLHPERQGIQALCEGLTDMCPVYSAWDPRLFPAAQALSLPFLFDSAEGATHVSEWLYRRHFSQDFEGQGVLMGRMVATSEYNLFSRTPMARLEDLAGQRIACSDGLESRIFAALGAIPVGCSTPEAKRRFADSNSSNQSI